MSMKTKEETQHFARPAGHAAEWVMLFDLKSEISNLRLPLGSEPSWGCSFKSEILNLKSPGGVSGTDPATLLPIPSPLGRGCRAAAFSPAAA